MVEHKGFLSQFSVSTHATTFPSYLQYISDGPMFGVTLDLDSTLVCTTLTVCFFGYDEDLALLGVYERRET